MEVIRDLLTHNMLDVKAKDFDGATALTIAIQKNNCEVERELLKPRRFDDLAMHDVVLAECDLPVDGNSKKRRRGDSSILGVRVSM